MSRPAGPSNAMALSLAPGPQVPQGPRGPAPAGGNEACTLMFRCGVFAFFFTWSALGGGVCGGHEPQLLVHRITGRQARRRILAWRCGVCFALFVTCSASCGVSHAFASQGDEELALALLARTMMAAGRMKEARFFERWRVRVRLCGHGGERDRRARSERGTERERER